VTRAAVTEAVTTSAVVGAPPGIEFSSKFGEINGGRSATDRPAWKTTRRRIRGAL